MNFPRPVSAITFDVGGTLIQPWPSVGHVYAEMAAQHGRKIAPAALNRRFAKAWRGFKHFNHRREDWAALVDATFEGLLERPPSESFFDELYDRFAAKRAWHEFADARPTLDALAARGFKLGIISNWDERLRPLLAALDLTQYFEAVVISCEVGFAKPSPVIFEEAARKLGAAPEFILHVGDSPECDAAGAAAGGFQSALLDRGAEELAAGVINSLAELRSLDLRP